MATERKISVDQQRQSRTNSDDLENRSSVPVSEGQCVSLSSACLAANGILTLLNLACYFLDRQVERLAQDFEQEGGFTERLYRVRKEKQKKDGSANI